MWQRDCEKTEAEKAVTAPSKDVERSSADKHVQSVDTSLGSSEPIQSSTFAGSSPAPEGADRQNRGEETQSLTPAQKRYLNRIRKAGSKGLTFNGRAKRPLKALEAAGLIFVEWDKVAQASGSGIQLVGRLHAIAKASGR